MIEEFDFSNLILTNESNNAWYKDSYQKLADKYCDGDISMVRKYAPSHLSWLAEFTRGVSCIITAGGFNDDIKKYSILPSVYNDLLTVFHNKTIIVTRQEKSRRKSKFNAAVNWCKENAGAQIKIKDFSQHVGWSYPTANKFVQDRVDLFSKISRGLYLVRNPDIERASDKNAAKNKA